MPAVTESAEQAYRNVARFMQAGDWRAADASCRRLTAQYPNWAAGWYTASRIAMAARSPANALDAVDRALRLEPANSQFLVHRAFCLLALNRPRDALDAAAAVERIAPTDAAIWDAIGLVRSRANEHRGALAAYDRAVGIAPQEAHFIFNRASVRRFVGDLEGAEADYDRAIALKPSDYEAYANRSELRVQTAARNHVREMEDLLTRAGPNWEGEVQLRFALAKEYEDLGEYAKSFGHLELGARTRRAHMQYDVAIDTATVDWIIEAFPVMAVGAQTAANTEAAASTEDPIFIVGLPRSGSTLVERILSSHSSLTSAGELECFAASLVDLVHRQSGAASSPLPRRELVKRSATLDFAALGFEYLGRARNVLHARGALQGAGRFIDKMPLNYLYCGLIRRALPHARIIHVTRHPMGVCYAMYKTLFKGGYPFSYDLGEIARYYIAYRRLMQHWDSIMPGAMLQVRYEDLVADQPAETRRILEFCQLAWEPACAEFEKNPAPSTTASAAQVRRPIYQSSVAQWQHHEQELSELREALAAAGYRD
jgi:tetratricopeptide (TPR) repeat protein